MKHIVLSAAMILVTAVCLSQNISGIVNDRDGKHLNGAKVMIGGSTQSGTTDANGEFFVKCKKGNQRIVISIDGYEPYDEKIIVGNGGTDLGTITLSPEHEHTDSIHVLEKLSEQRTPMTFSIYDHNYITERNIVREIPYILEHTPSFVALSEGGAGIGFTDFRIRGMNSNTTNVTINGIPLIDAESRQTLWHHLPDFASSVGQIKITRGAGSSTCGTYAYGSSIDITTESPSTKPYGDLTINGGSFNTIKASISAGTGIMKNGFSIDLRMAKILSDGYIDRADINHNAIMLSATWRGKNNSLNANIIYGNQKSKITMWGCPAQYIGYNRRYNSSGEYFDAIGRKEYYENEEEKSTQAHVQLIYAQKIWSNVELNFKLHYNHDDGYFEEFKNAQPFSNYGLPNIVLPVVVSGNGTTISTTTTIFRTDLTRRRMATKNYYGGIITATHKIGNFVNTFGGSVNKMSGQYYGILTWMQYAGNIEKDREWYKNLSEKTEYNAYYKAGYTFFDKLTLYADLQYRIINQEMNGNDCDLMPDRNMKTLDEDLDYNFFCPKGGINYEITPNMRLYASIAHTSREPSRNDIKEAVGDKNRTIDSESLNDFELGYSYKSDIFSGELNFYYMDFTNEIVPTGKFSQNGYSIMANVDKSYRTGIEIQALVRPLKKLSIEANATFSRNRIRDYVYWAETYDDNLNLSIEEYHTGETNTAFSPEIIAAGNINYNIFGNFNVYYNVKFVGKQYTDNTSSSDRMLKPYCINSIGIDYTVISKYVKALRFRFEVNNLFNTMYSDNAYGEIWYERGIQYSGMNYFPQAGITFMGGVTISF